MGPLIGQTMSMKITKNCTYFTQIDRLNWLKSDI